MDELIILDYGNGEVYLYTLPRLHMNDDEIEDWIEELIKEASPYNYSNDEIDSESITNLVTDDDFLAEFIDWYNNEG